jgi:hypothetical protein
MKIAHIPLVLVLLGVPAYVRDVIQFPLFGSRIFIVDIFLLVLGVLLYFQHSGKAKNFNSVYRNTMQALKIGNFVILVFSMFTFFCIFLLIFLYRVEDDYFFVLQMSTFIFSLIYLYFVVFNDGIKSFLNTFGVILWWVFGLQCCLYIVAYLFNIDGEINSHRNALAYSALLFYFLNFAYGYEKNRRYFLLVLMFALLNQVSGVLILLVVNFLFLLSNRVIFKFKLIRPLVGPIVILTIIIASYLSLDFLLFYLDLSLEELKAMEANRYNMSDSLVSIISRSVSVPFTMDAIFQGGNILGLSVYDFSKLNYWGYPVHNYFVTIIATGGIFGVMFSLNLLYFFYKVSISNTMLTISGIFLLSVSNDLFSVLILCFIPFFVRMPNSTRRDVTTNLISRKEVL